MCTQLKIFIYCVASFETNFENGFDTPISTLSRNLCCHIIFCLNNVFYVDKYKYFLLIEY